MRQLAITLREQSNTLGSTRSAGYDDTHMTPDAPPNQTDPPERRKESAGTQHGPSRANRSTRHTRVRTFWTIFAIAAVTLTLFRARALPLPLEADECNYAVIANILLNGGKLYIDAWDHQPPGVFVLVAATIKLFGGQPIVFRVLALVFSLISLLLLGKVGMKLGGPTCAHAAMLLFAVASSDPGTAGEDCNREIYMNTFVLLAVWALLAASPRDLTRAALAGSALALGSFIKTIVAVHWLILAVWIVAALGRGAKHGHMRTPRDLTLFILAFGIPPAILWTATTAYFYATARGPEFIDAVFLFNLGYSGGGDGLLARMADFFSPKGHPFVFDSAISLWCIGAIGTLTAIIVAVRTRAMSASIIPALAAGSFLAVCLPSRFWPHYYYLLIPTMVLAAAWLVVQPAFVRAISYSQRRAAPRILAAIAVAVVAAGQWKHYVAASDLDVTIERYNTRDFWGRAQGRNVAAVTDPGDRIFVYGNDASIYYYANRKCASRFTMLTGLATGQHLADVRRMVLLEELRANPPRLILVTFDHKPFDEWQRFLRENYTEPVGWDFHDIDTRNPIMFVVARKDAPIQQINWNWDRSQIGTEPGRPAP